MSRHDDSRSKGSGSDPEQALQNLFAHAEPRPAPPEADAEEIRRAVYAEWDAVTGRRVFNRRAAGAVAAAAVIASVALLVLDTGTGPTATVATVERVQGNVALEGSDVPLQVGAGVPQNALLTTRSGQIALRLADGGSLRLASQTELTLLAAAAVDLRAGALYFDSDGSVGPSRLEVRTAFGTLRDVGTQFSARLSPGRLQFGVRDGRVALARDDESVAADAGERVTVPQGAGGVRREPIASFGDEWAWAERLAPPFEIDGRPLMEFLAWVAHETGRALVFADPAAEQLARETVLSGSIDLEPLPKLAAVLTLTDLDYSVDGERIVISAK
jgi:ferric-dicitrate binding protein FerR (iron transport regulator)